MISNCGLKKVSFGFSLVLSVTICYVLLLPSTNAELEHENLELLNGSNVNESHKSSHDTGVHVASWRFNEVKAPFVVTSFILLIGIFKIGWHHLSVIAERVPESCMLILLGVVIGAFFRIDSNYETNVEFLKFNNMTFFMFLLPPIVLESAYSLRDRAFVENLGTILLYAVVGTIFNTLIVGFAMFGLHKLGVLSASTEPITFKLFHALVFGALIAAVDPVALLYIVNPLATGSTYMCIMVFDLYFSVLAIFQEVGVNKMLYFMVFGESLLNDAVTIVMYNLMVAFLEMETVGVAEVWLGIAAFCCVAGGGAIIGFLCGFFTAFVTKYAGKIRVVEPIALYSIAYLSYLLAEMVHFSGIVSIICCAIIQCQYADDNISSKSYVTVHFFAKVMSTVTESLIFIILGVMVVTQDHLFDWKFVLWVVFLVVVTRFVVVYALTYVVNMREAGIRKISTAEQLIMAYGGLRGAVSFSLAFMLDDKNVVPPDLKRLLLTATFAVILFTVFLQGMTMKPLVRLVRVRLQAKEHVNLFAEVNRGMVEHMIVGMEHVIGHHGMNYYLRSLKDFSQRCLRPALQKVPHRSGANLVAHYEEQTLQQKISAQPTPAHAGNVLFGELKLIDKSILPTAFAEVMMDIEDDAKTKIAHDSKRRTKKGAHGKKSRKPAPLKFSSGEDMLKLRDMLRSPLPMTLMYKQLDRNVKQDSELQRQLSHMADVRRMSVQRRRQSSGAVSPHEHVVTATSGGVLAAAFIPMAATGLGNFSMERRDDGVDAAAAPREKETKFHSIEEEETSPDEKKPLSKPFFF